MDKFGKRIKAMRLARGYTQSQLGEMLGISPSAVGMYERGKRKPNTELLVKLSSVFSVSTDYILGIVKVPDSVEEVMKQIFDAAAFSDGLTFNGVQLGKVDTIKIFDLMKLVANFILNEKARSAQEKTE